MRGEETARRLQVCDRRAFGLWKSVQYLVSSFHENLRLCNVYTKVCEGSRCGTKVAYEIERVLLERQKN